MGYLAYVCMTMAWVVFLFTRYFETKIVQRIWEYNDTKTFRFSVAFVCLIIGGVWGRNLNYIGHENVLIESLNAILLAVTFSAMVTFIFVAFAFCHDWIADMILGKPEAKPSGDWADAIIKRDNATPDIQVIPADIRLEPAPTERPKGNTAEERGEEIIKPRPPGILEQ